MAVSVADEQTGLKCPNTDCKVKATSECLLCHGESGTSEIEEVARRSIYSPHYVMDPQFYTPSSPGDSMSPTQSEIRSKEIGMLLS